MKPVALLTDLGTFECLKNSWRIKGLIFHKESEETCESSPANALGRGEGHRPIILERTAPAGTFPICLHMGFKFKLWLREAAHHLRHPLDLLFQSSTPASTPNQDELETTHLDEISRLASEIIMIDLNLPDGPEKERRIAEMVERSQQLALSTVTSVENNEQPSSAFTVKAPQQFALSPSLMPAKCSTAPEICLWAGRLSLRCHFENLAKAVYRPKGELPRDAIRKVAIMNVAYKQRWYWVEKDAGFDYPPGTTGRKIIPTKLPCGPKGLKWTDQWEAMATKDLYVAENGVARNHEHRPARGRWFFPQPSSLRYQIAQE
ncbi:hypothetical protein HDK77DRAFT_485692 [Phyllosticta capitalensis]|uniref:Uncharacterized protein n=1 Tax=Phyllosticta capitalensis TaxID=121624 RepID=A0ABR1YR11_9PEZI